MATTAGSQGVRERGVLIGQDEQEADRQHEVRSPFDGALIGRVGQASAYQARAAVELAHRALGAPLPAHERAAILERVADALEVHREDLAALICGEVGKPIVMARSEVDRAVSTYRISAAVARTLTGHVVPMDATAAGVGKIGYTVPHPLGVVTAITPFNFPLNLAAHKLAPALAAGCPVVLKPAPQAPLTAFLLADICAEAGLPPGYLSVVAGEPEDISEVIVNDPRVAAVSFTGSTAVGWRIAAAGHRKKVLLELGNASPAIVQPDADLARAARSLAPNAFAFAGQTCVSVQRIYVHEAVHREFVDLLVAETDRLVAGDPRDATVTCGPMIAQSAVQRTLSAIKAARSEGARVELGGDRRLDGVMPPTIVTNVDQGADLMQKEAFAPVVGVAAVRDFDQAVAQSNDSPFGLQAAVFTTDLDTSMRAMERLEFGTVLINEAPSFRTDNMPYGGLRDSGNTKEGPAWTAAELTAERLCILA